MLKSATSRRRGMLKDARHLWRRSGIAMAATIAVAGAALAAAPAAHADGGITPDGSGGVGGASALVTFRDTLEVCPPNRIPLTPCFDTGLGVAPGTNPAVTSLTWGFAVAFQGTDHGLWFYTASIASGNVVATFGPANLGMMAGTSPAITATGASSFEIAFQANTGILWTAASMSIPNQFQSVDPGVAGGANTGLPMDGGTSPNITTEPNGGYEVAYQDNKGSVAVYGSDGIGSLHLGMWPGTSPSITNASGNFEPGVNPQQATASYQIAFEANTSALWTVGSDGTGSLGLGMWPGTNPSITNVPGGGYQIAFQANTGMLWTVGSMGTGEIDVSTSTGSVSLPMQHGTSPSIFTDGSKPAASPQPVDYAIGYQTSNDQFAFAIGGPAFPHGPMSEIGNLSMDTHSSPSVSPANNITLNHLCEVNCP